MPATPSDIAKFTNDGVVISVPVNPADAEAIEALHVDAQNGGNEEIEMFFDEPYDAQAMLLEKFHYISQAATIHDGIEVEEAIGLGTSIPIGPIVPSARVIDASRAIDATARIRAFAKDLGSDRFSVEVLGPGNPYIGGGEEPPDPPSGSFPAYLLLLLDELGGGSSEAPPDPETVNFAGYFLTLFDELGGGAVPADAATDYVHYFTTIFDDF